MPFPGAGVTDALQVHRATEESAFGLISYPDYLELKASGDAAFAGVEGISRGFAASVRYGTEAGVVYGEAVTGDFFTLLGIPMRVGRSIGAADDQPGAEPAVVLSHAYWVDRFAGDEGVVGETLFLNNNPYTIVGVANEAFVGTTSARRPEVYLTHVEYRRVYWARSDRETDPAGRVISPLVRLAPGVSRQQASNVLVGLAAGLDDATPLDEGRRRLLLDDATWVDPSARLAEMPTAKIMFAAAAGLLLLACVNVATLALAAGTRRRQEIALRAAIGASRTRLVRQLLTERVLPALVAGGIALALAGPTSNWIGSFFARPSVWGANVPRTVHMDGSVFLFAAVAALLTGIISGLLPAYVGPRQHLTAVLKGLPAAAGRRRLLGGRDLLVSAQIALSLTLLVVASLVVRTLDAASDTDPGFQTDGLVASYVSTSSMGTPIPERHQFYRELAQRLEALPWVRAATIADYAPLSGHGTGEIQMDADASTLTVLVAKVNPGYLETLDIDVLTGRSFQASDSLDGALVAIVDEALARRLDPSGNPVGREITWTTGGVDGPRTTEIVGVVRATRMQTLLGDAEEHLYIAYPQHYSTPGNAVMVSANVGPAAAVRLLEEEYKAVDPRLAVVNVLSYDDVIRGFVYTQRMNAQLFSAVALLGLFLSVVGILGVMTLAVSARTKEIGVRLAVGAGRADIARLVSLQFAVSVGLGMLLGFAGAVFAGRWTVSLLVGVEPFDAVSFAAAAVILAAASAVAAVMPTRRALRVNPTESLRAE
jgi:predicted permease